MLRRLLLVLLRLLAWSAEGIERALSTYRSLVVLLGLLIISLVETLILVISCLELILLLLLWHTPELLLLLTITCHCCSILLLLLRHSTLVVISVSHLVLNTILHLIKNLLLWRWHLAHENWVWNKFRLFLFRLWLLSSRLLIII